MDFDALAVGQSHRHTLTRTLTEADNLLASALIMSSEPLQLDAVFAGRHAPSGERLFNSVFTLGLMIGISDRDFAAPAPNEGIEDAVFPRPARIGDTIRVESEVLALDRDARRVRLRHRALTAEDACIGIATREVRLP